MSNCVKRLHSVPNPLLPISLIKFATSEPWRNLLICISIHKRIACHLLCAANGCQTLFCAKFYSGHAASSRADSEHRSPHRPNCAGPRLQLSDSGCIYNPLFHPPAFCCILGRRLEYGPCLLYIVQCTPPGVGSKGYSDVHAWKGWC